jgi:hypothetical protein
MADARAILATGAVVEDPQSAILLKGAGIRPEARTAVLREIPEVTLYEIS